MGKFDADRLRDRLERLNRGQLARLEQFAEELLREAERTRRGPKRTDDADPPSTTRVTRATGRRPGDGS